MPTLTTTAIASINVAALASAARRGEVDTDIELGIVGACLVLAGTITLQLETTRLAAGGLRLWARCPGCSARAAVLFLAAPGLRCRRCAGLVYPATRQRPEERVLEQAFARRTKARAALGAGPDPREPLPRRPQGVRFSTWVRRLDELHEAQAAVQAALAALVDRLGARSGALAQEAGSPSPAPPAARTPAAPSREGQQARGTMP
ncbi:hypothetical protein BE17_14570 [Sorangium cellulosum]|uniref:Uncharacterized protein n=1 Tax=Sorangium cellulosum TaxID=56 RepID=A0A150SAY5_SORCE|nr:hypothetical protein BE17_14570 [Sorangium cellulosum]